MAGILPVDPAGLFLGSRIELTLDRYGTVIVAHDQTRVPLEAEKQMKIYRCRYRLAPKLLKKRAFRNHVVPVQQHHR